MDTEGQGHERRFHGSLVQGIERFERPIRVRRQVGEDLADG